jgi:hypothetical protein
MASRRYFDGAQYEMGMIPIEQVIAALIGAFWGIRVPF